MLTSADTECQFALNVRRCVLAIDGEMTPGLWPRPKPTRPWNCRQDDPTCSKKTMCVSCRNRLNRASGRRKQRSAQKALETVTGVRVARFRGQAANEETWGFGIRVEAKSGAQVGPTATRFLAAEAQSQASKRHGDSRPFAMASMPVGWGSDGIFSCRLSDLSRVVEALVNG